MQTHAQTSTCTQSERERENNKKKHIDMQGDGPTWFTRVGSALTATGYSSVRREDRRSSRDFMLDIRLRVQMGEYVP